MTAEDPPTVRELPEFTTPFEAEFGPKEPTVVEPLAGIVLELARDLVGQVAYIRASAIETIKGYIGRLADAGDLDAVSMDAADYLTMLKGKKHSYGGPIRALFAKVVTLHPAGVVCRWTRIGGWEQWQLK